jgi:HlyD family secretion protein
MTRSRILLLFITLVAACGLATCQSQSIKESDDVQASGYLEGRIYTLASALGGRIVSVDVERGEYVETGQSLVSFDATLWEHTREQAQAGVDAALADVNALDERPTAAELAQMEASLAVAQAELDAAEAGLELLISSYEPLDPPESDLHAARSAITIAEAGVELAEAQLTQVEAGPLEGEGKIAQALLEEAEANLDLVELQMQELTLIAPQDGIVMQVLSREGEIVAPGTPIVYLMDPDQLTLTLYVPVVNVTRINIGDDVEISADSYPGEVFTGSVFHIADEAQFTPATVLTEEERVKLVFAVKVLLKDTSGRLKPGMPVDAVIQP